MKSVIGTIIMFLVLYVVISNDMLSFFAQDSVLIFAIGSIVVLLIVAVCVLGLPSLESLKGGYHEESDKHHD